MRNLVFGLLFVTCCLFSNAAQAWRYDVVGYEIFKIQDVDLKSPDGESLYLGYVVTTYGLGGVFGVYFQDGGYALGVRARGRNQEYYSMPSPEMVRKFQEQGLLPYPLPEYQLGIDHYIKGYSLIIMLGIVMIVLGIRRLLGIS